MDAELNMDAEGANGGTKLQADSEAVCLSASVTG